MSRPAFAAAVVAAAAAAAAATTKVETVVSMQSYDFHPHLYAM